MESYSEFCIEIDYKKNTGDPTRVFRSLANYITALQKIDSHLITAIHPRIKPVIVLDDVESGSVRVFLKTLLEQVDDDALKNLDWKPLVGQYMVKAKYTMIRFLEDKEKIDTMQQIELLQDEILQIAKETDVRQIPYYRPIDHISLLEDYKNLHEASLALGDEDKVIYEADCGRVELNKDFVITAEDIEDLLIRETISNPETLILKVKKPDYLGESKWQFYAGRIVEAKIEDEHWLRRFQERDLGAEVLPGDSLKVKAMRTTSYGFSGDIISEELVVTEVLEVLKPPKQGVLF